jgi:conjugal transfer pilus assembly protein TraB
MPNKKQSRLKDCVALASSYGDLSDDSVVMHLERLSCASGDANFEKKVYGGVFDSDAMQDVRGKAILKTKPLLQYSAAAGLLAGIGDGLRNYGTAQSINTNGSITTFSATDLGRSALGGAVSAPSTQVANYIMKIVDIYHPVVKARAGRVVTVLFTQGFSIDHDFQKYQAVDVSKQGVSENSDSDDRSLRYGFLNKESKKASASDFLNNNKSETLFTNVDKNGGGK